MSDREGGQPRGVLEPPPGAAYYETLPLSGVKRQRVDDGDNDFGESQLGSLPPQTATSQHNSGEQNPEKVSNPVNNAANAGIPSPVKKTRKRTANVNIKNTRTTNNGLEVEIDGVWMLAIYHSVYVNHFRDQLYAQPYTHDRDFGQVGVNNGQFDKTSYLEAQKDWGKDRLHRPAILFELKHVGNAHPATNPGDLTCLVNGVRRVMIDVITNKPLRAFDHIPITISTKVEGWLLEAWFRQDASLKAEDLIQRMPYTSNDNVYPGRTIINRLVRRRELFRDSGRCLSWTKDTYTKTWDLNLLEEIKANPNPADPNSTRHLQDLTVDQTTAVKDAIYISGNHMRKAGTRQLEGEKKAQKLQKIEDRKANREATLATMPLNKSKIGNAHSKQRQVKRMKTKSTVAEDASNDTAEKLQENARLPVEGYPAVPMSHPNIQNIAQAGMRSGVNDEGSRNGAPVTMPYPNMRTSAQAGVTSGLYGEESRVNVPTGYPVHHGSGADPRAGGYPAPHCMDGNRPRAPLRPGVPMVRYPTSMLPPAQISTNLSDHQAIAGYDHGELQPSHRTYGQNPRDYSSAVLGQSTRTAISSPGMSQGRPQPSNAYSAGNMNNFDQSQTYPMNRDLYHSGNADSLAFESAWKHPRLNQDWAPSVFFPHHPTYTHSERHHTGHMQNPGSLPAYPQYDRNAYVDQNGHNWTVMDPGTHNDSHPEYAAARYSFPAASNSGMRRGDMIDQHRQQNLYSHAQGSKVAGTSQTSSKKRGADTAFDDDTWVRSSSKMQKLN